MVGVAPEVHLWAAWRWGVSATRTYTWDASGATTGVHRLTASHDWADDDADNDSWTVTVTVAEAALPEVIISSVTPRVLWAGM